MPPTPDTTSAEPKPKKVRPILFSVHVHINPPQKGSAPFETETVLAVVMGMASWFRSTDSRFKPLRVLGLAKSLDCGSAFDLLIKWKCTDRDADEFGAIVERVGRELIGKFVAHLSGQLVDSKQPWAPLTIHNISRYHAQDVWDSKPQEDPTSYAPKANPPTTPPPAADPLPEQPGPITPVEEEFANIDRMFARLKNSVPAGPAVIPLRDLVIKAGKLTPDSYFLPDPAQSYAAGFSCEEWCQALHTVLMLAGIIQPTPRLTRKDQGGKIGTPEETVEGLFRAQNPV